MSSSHHQQPSTPPKSPRQLSPIQNNRSRPTPVVTQVNNTNTEPVTSPFRTNVIDDDSEAPSPLIQEVSVFQLERGIVPTQRYTALSARHSDLQDRLKTLKGEAPIPPVLLATPEHVPLSTLKELRNQRWAKNPPTTNEHLLAVMRNVENPWENRVATILDADQCSNLVESLYYSPKTLVNVNSFMPRKQQDCVIVCGVMRVGHTPVLHILDMLRRGYAARQRESEFVQNILWLEGLVNQLDPEADPLAESMQSFGTIAPDPITGNERVLVKSHCPVRQFIEKNKTPGPGKSASKLVCVLRHPLHVRQSWFNHVRKVFKAYLPNEDFPFSMDDFAKHPLGAPQLIPLSTGYVDSDYEDYMTDVLTAYEKHPSMVAIVFFEDLIARPLDVVRDLADFTGWNHFAEDGTSNEQLFLAVAASLRVPLRPAPRYLKYSLLHLQNQYDVRFRRNFPTLDKYETLYKHITRKDYPFVRIQNTSMLNRLSMRMSVGGGASRHSSRQRTDMTPKEVLYEGMDMPPISPLKITSDRPSKQSTGSQWLGAVKKALSLDRRHHKDKKPQDKGAAIETGTELTLEEQELMLIERRRARRTIKMEKANEAQVTEEGQLAMDDEDGDGDM